MSQEGLLRAKSPVELYFLLRLFVLAAKHNASTCKIESFQIADASLSIIKVADSRGGCNVHECTSYNAPENGYHMQPRTNLRGVRG